MEALNDNNAFARDASDGMASVNTLIGYGSQLKERVNGQPKTSDIGNKSELSIKNCSVNEAFNAQGAHLPCVLWHPAL